MRELINLDERTQTSMLCIQDNFLIKASSRNLNKHLTKKTSVHLYISFF